MILQIIILIFAGAMILKILLDLRKNKISLRKFVLWAVIWVALIVVVFIPSIVVFLAETVGIERARDLPIYVAIIILFYLLFRIGVKIEKIEQEMTKLVKNLALKKK